MAVVDSSVTGKIANTRIFRALVLSAFKKARNFFLYQVLEQRFPFQKYLNFRVFQRLAVILKINLEKDKLTQMICKHFNSTFAGPKPEFYIMRMNHCEVSDKL